ncbi:26S proteasome non-ATPase regulatory subunit 9-like [Ctenocephalides felis]|uniref:26S proteasome non-ATPase regulatory subunit 9-like n=1 Tax=Ctenocephalides felis TaxID=7515 RepID=UPI000E6E2A9E|nr:26S proteasome non-ATPase regulatory subunit 9-like [Ctenocephalides felis]
MKAIENGLHEIHEPLLSAGASSSDSATSLNIQKGADLIKELHIQKSMKKKPFAKITVVSVDSPAQQAGLIVGDVITEFGSLHFDNFTSLHQIGQIVSNSVGKNVVVVVLRHGAPMKLNLVPQKWHLIRTQ